MHPQHTTESPTARLPTGRIIRARDRASSPSPAEPPSASCKGTTTLPRLALSAFSVGLLFATGMVFGLSGPRIEDPLQGEPVADVVISKASGVSQARAIAALYREATYERDVYSPAEPVAAISPSKPSSLRLVAASAEISKPKSRPKAATKAAVTTLPASYKPPLPKAPASTLSQRVLKIIQLHSPKHSDPRALADRIVRESAKQEYDPLFVAAVIKSESGFDALARSHVGARGLMQIMPATGAYMAGKLNIKKVQLYDSDQNLKLGIAFLKELEASYGGDKVMTLVAYNWGPGHVELAGKGKRRIPGDVMRYAVKILNDYRRWRGEIPSATALG